MLDSVGGSGLQSGQSLPPPTQTTPTNQSDSAREGKQICHNNNIVDPESPKRKKKEDPSAKQHQENQKEGGEKDEKVGK